MKRAIAFTRVSTEKQDEGIRQLVQIKNFCKGRYELLEDRAITEVISGTIKVRDGLTELMNLTTEDCDVVIISESSRLTRAASMLTLPLTIETIQSIGLDLIVIGSNENKVYKANELLNPMECMYLVFEAYKNREELATSKKRFKTGKEAALKLNKYVGHTMPFGYKVNKTDKGYFEIVEEQAEIMRLMFDLVYSQGYSVNKTAISMVRTHNTSWNTSSVLRHLRNPVYKGEFTIMNHTMQVPAIVSPEVFDAVQEKISSNHLFISKGTKHVNTFKGLSKCACGCSTYIRRAGAYKGETYYNYICLSKHTAHTQLQACNNSGISVSLLDKIVWNATKSYINVADFKVKTEVQKKLIASESKGIERQIHSLKAEKTEIESRVGNILKSISRTDNAKVQKMLDNELSGLIEETEKVDKKLESLNKEYIKLQSKLNDLASTLLFSQVSNTTIEEKNEIYLKYIEKVTYYSINLNKGFVVIDYKNGAKMIVVTSSRPKNEAYQLPQTFKFNPENRTVLTALDIPVIDAEFAAFNNPKVETTFVDGTDFEIPEENKMVSRTNTDIEITVNPTTYKEASYSELFERFNMEEFKMVFD